MTRLGTVALDGEAILCRREWGAELTMPLRCDVLALEALEAATEHARRVWHSGAYLARPRIERGALTLDVVERPASRGRYDVHAPVRAESARTMAEQGGLA